MISGGCGQRPPPHPGLSTLLPGSPLPSTPRPPRPPCLSSAILEPGCSSIPWSLPPRGPLLPHSEPTLGLAGPEPEAGRLGDGASQLLGSNEAGPSSEGRALVSGCMCAHACIHPLIRGVDCSSFCRERGRTWGLPQGGSGDKTSCSVLGCPEVRAVSTEVETGTGREGLGAGWSWALGCCGGLRSLARREAGRQADHGGGAGLWPEGRNQVFHSVSVGLMWPVPLGYLPHHNRLNIWGLELTLPSDSRPHQGRDYPSRSPLESRAWHPSFPTHSLG